MELVAYESRSSVNDIQLISRVVAGDAAAERELYETYVDRIYRTGLYAGDVHQGIRKDRKFSWGIVAFDLAALDRRLGCSEWLAENEKNPDERSADGRRDVNRSDAGGG
jgi:hypothetical protein